MSSYQSGFDVVDGYGVCSAPQNDHSSVALASLLYKLVQWVGADTPFVLRVGSRAREGALRMPQQGRPGRERRAETCSDALHCSDRGNASQAFRASAAKL